MRGKLFKQAALVILLTTIFCTAFAQAPVITYQTPQHYLRNAVITPLAPTNTGGAVPATKYGQVSTVMLHSAPITGIVVDKSGNIFYEDWENNTIWKYSTAGVRAVFAGSSAAGTKNGQGVHANFNQPDGIIIDPDGNLFVGDQTNRLIRKITPGGYVTTIAGSGSIGSADGLGHAAGFYDPRGLALDAANNIYVADQGNNKIRKVTQAGLVTTYAGTGVAGFTDGPRNVATLNTPTGMGIDAAGNLYVADAANNAVRKITPQQDVTTFATGFNFPREVRLDAAGYAYVTNQNGRTISRISPAGEVSTLAGTGNAGIKDGPGNIATFYSPLGLTIDNKGNLFVGDNISNRIRKIVITGYSIDKPLPAGLIFDTATGIISGTPTALSPLKNYTVTAFNLAGASSTIVQLQVTDPLLSVITFPQPTAAQIGADNILQTGATSTNAETPIVYTSSNPAVAVIGADGQIHVLAPGQTTITANQAGNSIYLPAQPVARTFTVLQEQNIEFAAIPTKSICDPDFLANAVSSNPTIALNYSSSNPAVVTVSPNGNVHIIAAGNTTITVTQTGSDLFIPATPKEQVLTVAPPVVPIVSIAPDKVAVCIGASVTYTASTLNVSGNLSYQWRVNGVNAGSNSNSFNMIPVATTDAVECIVTNIASCNSKGTSNTYSGIVINPYFTPAVSIISSVGNVAVCSGTQITFNATPLNGGTGPVLQWQVNGVNAGDNSSTFSGNDFNNGDVISCILTADGSSCLTTPNATSNTVAVNIITPGAVPTVSISVTNVAYIGSMVTVTAVAENAGQVTKYQWQVNGENVGDNSATFKSSTLKNNDKVTCTITSNVACSVPAVSEELTLDLLPSLAVGIPNTFSPNNDGINDYWNIPALIGYPNCLVNIYDRNGTVIFRSKGYNKPWDGIYNGKQLPTATYYYIVNLPGSSQKVSGQVTILR